MKIAVVLEAFLEVADEAVPHPVLVIVIEPVDALDIKGHGRKETYFGSRFGGKPYETQAAYSSEIAS